MFCRHNLNQELANLALRRLVAAWRAVFDEVVPQLTLDLQHELDRSLRRFHAAALASVDNTPASVNQRLRSIKRATAESFAQHLQTTEEGIRNGSKDPHRGFAESIAEGLRETYQACAEQHGMLIFFFLSLSLFFLFYFFFFLFYNYYFDFIMSRRKWIGFTDPRRPGNPATDP